MERSVEELSKYRFECSVEALEEARIMFDSGKYKNALNRGYYSIFHAMRAVNVLDGFDSSKHSGVISYFNKTYVKEGIFDKDASKIISTASDRRENADYLDFYIASRDEAEAQISRASKFNDWIRKYLEDKGII